MGGGGGDFRGQVAYFFPEFENGHGAFDGSGVREEEQLYHMIGWRLSQIISLIEMNFNLKFHL